ncbi:hypothetical protein [Microtetraspora sp. NBRC 16547]|uniref:hypothetical protein n=1 Tax=Microtetraspora sp. NBRC 16547 TaxID=3030993 RepID=UPI0025543D0F|nr:hypothetical protein [Microtetraspora sp. NBRC 16547]
MKIVEPRSIPARTAFARAARRGPRPVLLLDVPRVRALWFQMEGGSTADVVSG